MSKKDLPKGKVVSVVGVVADVYFADHIPQTYSAIEVRVEGQKVVLEVQSHLGGRSGANRGHDKHRWNVLGHGSGRHPDSYFRSGGRSCAGSGL